MDFFFLSVKVILQQKQKFLFTNIDGICWRENVREKKETEHCPFTPIQIVWYPDPLLSTSSFVLEKKKKREIKKKTNNFQLCSRRNFIWS